MINGGDEFRRTQRGNNNAYCQHNQISWYDWRLMRTHADIFRFARHVIAMRKRHPVFRRTSFFTGLDIDGDQYRDIHWYHPDGGDATWDPAEKCLMARLDGSKEETGADRDDLDVLLLFNASSESRQFFLPELPHHGNRRLMIDTSRPAPYDVYAEDKAPELHPKSKTYRVQPHSMVVMFSTWRRPSIEG
jgi:glycogen operon protein